MNHPVQITDDGTVPQELNFIFWLKKHLWDRGIDFKDLGSDRLKEKGTEKVWHWSCEGAREIFQDRSIKAGFPKGLFSYHSLRAGFLCQALLKAGNSAELDGILEHTAFVAGWKVGGAA